MRSTWGSYAQSLRARIGLSQTEFADRIGESLARVSNLEYQRTNIGTDVLEKYIQVLASNDQEAKKLREQAEYSNKRRGFKAQNIPEDRTMALITQYLPGLSKVGRKKVDVALEQILKVIEEERGKEIASLTYSSTKYRQPRKLRQRKETAWSMLTPARFVELCLLAEEYRRRYFSNKQKVDIEVFCSGIEIEDATIGFDIVGAMPSFCEGAYACILGEPTGHRILIEQSRHLKVIKRGCVFGRHVMMHEFAHHVLHGNLLETSGQCFLQPQELAKLSDAEMFEAEASNNNITQIVDTLIEVEAECFATLILVPWTEFLIGKETYLLAEDFGEQRSEVVRYAAYFKVRSVFEPLSAVLWARRLM